MFGYGGTVKDMAAPLREAKLCLCAALRQTKISGPGWTQRLPVSVLYVAAAPAAAPRQLVVPRSSPAAGEEPP